MLKVRNLLEEEYISLCEFWKFWRFPAPKREMLPNDFKYSVAVTNEENIVCAGFLYITPSAFCFIEFIVSNPSVRDRIIRREALILLIDTISSLATKMGFKLMFTFVKNENLINKYLECGFVKGSASIEMIKKL